MATTGINPDGTERERLDQLPQQANLAGWGTHRSTESGHGTGNPERAKDSLCRLEDQVFGVTPAGTNASTARPAESRTNLNPFFSGFLMGYPAAWTLSALQAWGFLSREKSPGAPPS
jgi:hypothetical protein